MRRSLKLTIALAEHVPYIYSMQVPVLLLRY